MRRVSLLFLLLFNIVYGVTKEIEVEIGWNQLTVPLDNINLHKLADESTIIWQYAFEHNGTNKIWKAYTKDQTPLDQIALNSEIELIAHLDKGDGIYLLASSQTITFEGDEPNYAQMPFIGLYNEWQTLSARSFNKPDGGYISTILGKRPAIAMRVINDKLVGYSTDEEIKNKLEDAGIFEDFYINHQESFWAKNTKVVDDLFVSDISILGYTDIGEIPASYEGGRKITVGIEITSDKELNLVTIDLLVTPN